LALLGFSAIARGYIANSALWLSASAWVKVWPAAILANIAINQAWRRHLLVPTAIFSGSILIVGVLLGGNANLFSFITQQSARGLQLESVVATPWVWNSAFNEASSIYYDTSFLTFQVQGPLASETAAAMTWWMLLALAVCMALLLVASWRNHDSFQLLAIGSLLLTLVLIVFNKVGSPQYLGWLIFPVLLGLHARVSHWWPAWLGVLIATALTQWAYPFSYESLIEAEVWAVALLTVRNALEVALLAWVFWRLLWLVFKKQTK
jgi:hypothetical protein